MPRGGHFAAMEEPDLFVDEVRAWAGAHSAPAASLGERNVMKGIRPMPALEAVRPIALAEIEAARERGSPGRLRAHAAGEAGAGRGLSGHPAEAREPAADQRLQAARRGQRGGHAERGRARRGVWTISAGNAGQGVAYAARKAGVPCTVVAIETAPASKLERMRALGARLVTVPYEVAWKALDDRAYPGVEGTFIHPFDDHNFIAGHATMGLEILEDAPDAAAVIGGVGGGGLITGVGSAIKALKPDIKVWTRRARDRRAGRAVLRRRLAADLSRNGRPRSSTAPAARASSRACGSG